MTRNSWLVITSRNLFLLAAIPKLNRRMKCVHHLGLHCSRDLFENCLEFDLLINSYFEGFKGRWDFCGCAVCYSKIFMLNSKNENVLLQ